MSAKQKFYTAKFTGLSSKKQDSIDEILQELTEGGNVAFLRKGTVAGHHDLGGIRKPKDGTLFIGAQAKSLGPVHQLAVDLPKFLAVRRILFPGLFKFRIMNMVRILVDGYFDKIVLGRPSRMKNDFARLSIISSQAPFRFVLFENHRKRHPARINREEKILVVIRVVYHLCWP